MNAVEPHQTKGPEALAAAMTAAGLEHGFAGLDLRTEIAALARARLGLLEEKVNGRLPLPPDFFEQRMRTFDAAIATARSVDEQGTTLATPALAGLALAMDPQGLIAGEGQSTAATAAAAGAAVLILAGRHSRRRVRGLLLHARRGVTAWRLRRAEQRHRQAREWVERHLPVLLASYDIACRRAARAGEIQSLQVRREERPSC